MKRLYRSRRDRMVAGIASGMAEYLNVDPTIVRLVWVLLLLPGGVPGLLLYVLFWIIMPEEPGAISDHAPFDQSSRSSVSPTVTETRPTLADAGETRPTGTPVPEEDRPAPPTER